MSIKKKSDSLTFEDHLIKAKNIIEKLESGNCNLDEMLNLYEEAVESIGYCNNKLSEFENKINIIKKTSDNTFEIDQE